MPVEHPRKIGRLVVICGCMFAGKTTELIARLQAAARAGRTTRAFKHVLDARYHPTQLATHDRRAFDAQAVTHAREIAAAANSADVIGIDEAHFFGRDLMPICEDLRVRGCDIVVVGLENDAWGQPFPPIPELTRIADEILRMRAPCTLCGAPAPYSQRMAPLADDDMVGGPGDYEPRCASCFTPLSTPAPQYA